MNAELQRRGGAQREVAVRALISEARRLRKRERRNSWPVGLPSCADGLGASGEARRRLDAGVRKLR